MSETESRNIAEGAYRQAMEIIDREWLATGVTQEDLAQDEQLAEIFDSLVGCGRTVKDIRAEWETKTVEEILQNYALPVLERQSA